MIGTQNTWHKGGLAMGLFDFIFGDDDEGYPDVSDDQAEETAWKECGNDDPRSNSDTSGNEPDDDD
ncbi:hypothetical protein A2524_02810 [Candidatus Wolfebacteria bacterium RIFOXYD12_FULL_48_21]|nr:MAG: hypothetical protein A2524_02810 [Candidatus Wolfebacteria bacterium RIFOXYD12_FULL_48_21]OGM96781.1 MAG: hypothetical protein A2532_02635 [Candidatus Wolfebacteria bacterium RIFOXYD2_FULL_48_11]